MQPLSSGSGSRHCRAAYLLIHPEDLLVLTFPVRANLLQYPGELLRARREELRVPWTYSLKLEELEFKNITFFERVEKILRVPI